MTHRNVSYSSLFRTLLLCTLFADLANCLSISAPSSQKYESLLNRWNTKV